MQYDLDAHMASTIGVEGLAAIIRTHRVTRYGAWEATGRSGRVLSFMPVVWYQALSIAAQAAAEEIQNRVGTGRPSQRQRDARALHQEQGATNR